LFDIRKSFYGFKILLFFKWIIQKINLSIFRKAKAIRKPVLTENVTSNSKAKLKREVSTGTLKGGTNSNTDIDANVQSTIDDENNFDSNQSRIASAGSDNRAISESSQTRRPFKSDESSKFSENLFYSFKQKSNPQPKESSSERNSNKKFCCGLFEEDDGDFDDNIWTCFDPYKFLEANFFPSKIIVSIYFFLLIASLILLILLYNIISMLFIKSKD
jgi:hypothetical protein